MSAVADGVGCGLCAPAARGRESGAGRERDSIADGTALHRGRVGSRHFRELEEKSPGSLVFTSM